MTRVVLAERWWLRANEQPVFTRSYPGVLNWLSALATGYALLSAVRRRPRATALAGAWSMGLKFWYVGALVRRYDAAQPGNTAD
jgi:hypothetical protein